MEQPIARATALRALGRKQVTAPASVQPGEGPAGGRFGFFRIFGAEFRDCPSQVLANVAKEAASRWSGLMNSNVKL
eukprot:5081109-Pyramimonas_sp.AAC.1